MKRTLIEFYDEDQLENVYALFGSRYDAVIYLCPEEPAPAVRAVLTRFLEGRFHLTPRFLWPRGREMAEVVDCLRRLTEDAGEHHIDITGGSSVFAAAAGMLAAECSRVTILQYDIARGERVFCHPADSSCACRPEATLTVPEMIALGGGRLQPGERQSSPVLTESLRREVLRLWEAVGDDIRSWNHFCTFSPLEGLEPGWEGRRAPTHREQSLRAVLNRLGGKGIVSGVHTRRQGERLETRFRFHVPEEAAFLYEKAGNVLEMVARMAAEDSGLFADCMTGAMLDWTAAPVWGQTPPSNEVDLVLTWGHIPVFVSCKGTQVEKDYLYEINTLAGHYGGIYAKAAIFSTEPSDPAIRRRAKEMGILLIDSISVLGADGLTEKLKRIFQTH